MNITKYAEQYIDEVRGDPLDGRHSWSRCYVAFNHSTEDEHLALILGHYLANFGMMRSSSNLGSRNELVHVEAVKRLRGALPNLRGQLLKANHVEPIQKLCKALQSHYNQHSVSPTDTLITKIIMGTLGTLPALDRLVLRAARQDGLFTPRLSADGLNSLVNFTAKHADELIELSNRFDIPPMRILDMALVKYGGQLP